MYNDNNIPLKNLLSDPIEKIDKNYYKYQFTLTHEWNVLHQVFENKHLIPFVGKWIRSHQD